LHQQILHQKFDANMMIPVCGIRFLYERVSPHYCPVYNNAKNNNNNKELKICSAIYLLESHYVV